MTRIDNEIGALRRMTCRRGPNQEIARKRVAIKRRLRAAGLRFDPTIPTPALIALAKATT